MKKLGVLMMLLLLALPMVTLAQVENNNVMEFRPLGRFKMAGYGYATSWDGLLVAEVTQGAGGSLELDADLAILCDMNEDEIVAMLAGLSEGEIQLFLDEVALLCSDTPSPTGDYNDVMSIWDIRGGRRLWTVNLPPRELLSIEFSPMNDSVMVKTAAPYPAEEEIRLSFYDVKTGNLISETGDIDILDAPIIPGTLVQSLNAEPRYTADGQHVMVSYWRRTEAPRCAVWEVATAVLIWEKEALCGRLSADGSLMIIPEPHANPHSAYNQISVYEVATGEWVAASEDEVLDYAWLDEARVVIHRPYGDPPMIWDVLQNTRAVMELPYPLGTFAPLSLRRVLVYTDENIVTSIWDKETGKLLGQTSVQGYAFERETGVLVLDFDEETMTAIDLETNEELWRVPWHHYVIEARPDGGQMLAVNEETYQTEVFDLNTGKVIGTLPFYEGDFYLTQNWEFLVEVTNNTYTIWGAEDKVEWFENPPNARVSAEQAQLYYEANTQFPRSSVLAGTYLWVTHRSADGQWYLVDSEWGDVQWIRAREVERLDSGEDLPVYP